MEKVNWKVEGMTCSNCALTVTRYLQKEGMEDVAVNPLDGNVSFTAAHEIPVDKLKKGIGKLGYRVADNESAITKKSANFLSDNKGRFLFTLPFTAILMLHMLHRWVPLHWLMMPWVQLSLCLPVFITGMYYFGSSAIQSIRNLLPNMNVLVTLGALAAFVYSFFGVFVLKDNQYLFFETTASIITLVFLGNYLEEASVQSTQRALNKLMKYQKTMANMIAFDDQHQEQIFPIENSQLKNGDLILIKTGEQVPIDCKILWGDCTVNEAIVTGESIPLSKSKKDFLIGGSMLESGTVKAQVTATGDETILSGIVKMIQKAQSEKPPLQKTADKISAVFIPVVIFIAIFAFILNHYMFDVTLSASLMRAIAVLVISCPCAMGIATPAAIAVGLGRAAKKGILFRNASSLESFKSVRQIVFDKTGTLTTGNFTIEKYHCNVDDAYFREIVSSMEKFSGHPIAQSICSEWKNGRTFQWKSIEEIKGIGVRAQDMEGNIFEAGSPALLTDDITEREHNVFVLKNKKLMGWIDVKDEIRPEAKAMVDWLHSQKISTVLLTGDADAKAAQVGQTLGITRIFARQTPAQKLQKIEALNSDMPTAMVGDGINDAPALAKATLGISLSSASQLAVQHADVILMNNGLKNLPEALGIGKHTHKTIRQNLFWAFSYNIIAIPIAAMGMLNPTFSALAMAFSDIILAANSLKLFVKKVL